jgi:hypothetical protein
VPGAGDRGDHGGQPSPDHYPVPRRGRQRWTRWIFRRRARLASGDYALAAREHRCAAPVKRSTPPPWDAPRDAVSCSEETKYQATNRSNVLAKSRLPAPRLRSAADRDVCGGHEREPARSRHSVSWTWVGGVFSCAPFAGLMLTSSACAAAGVANSSENKTAIRRPDPRPRSAWSMRSAGRCPLPIRP